RRAETLARSDDQGSLGTPWRLCEGACVGELAAEIQPAHEGHDLAERYALARAEPAGEVRLRVLGQHEPRPDAAAVRGREQEDPARAVLADERDVLARQPELRQQRRDAGGEAEAIPPGAAVGEADAPERERSDRGERPRVPRLVDGAEREEMVRK